MILYHHAYERDRDSIAERGLEARDTCLHNYGPCTEDAEWDNKGVLAVYASTKPGYWKRNDIWEIDATDLPVELDPVLAGTNENHPARRIRADVPPERIRLVTFEDGQLIGAMPALPNANEDIVF